MGQRDTSRDYGIMYLDTSNSTILQSAHLQLLSDVLEMLVQCFFRFSDELQSKVESALPDIPMPTCLPPSPPEYPETSSGP